MRIVIDMQGAQTDSQFRGIGRYTLSLTRAIVRQAQQHEILLALNGQFPDSVARVRRHFEGLVPAQNILVFNTPSVLDGARRLVESRQTLAQDVREAFLASLQPDVIHISSLFEGFSDEAITSIGVLDQSTPVSVIIYDLIPFLSPEQYLKHNAQFEQHYYQKIEYLKRAAHYFAISDFAKAEAVQTLGISAAKVTNIFGAIDESLQCIRGDALPDQTCLKALGINKAFILHTGGGDERKNLPRLIQAYAKLPPTLRDKHQLVFAGRMSPVVLAHLRRCATAVGVRPDELVFTKFISDAVLARLYTDCALYVFPSRHEGLGLPAMEAMAFDAPVIASNTSSLPEVVGKSDALFDPFDVDDIRNMICQVLENPEFRDELIAHGKQRVEEFSWDESARRVVNAWEAMQHNADRDRITWRDIQERHQGLHRQTLDSLAQGLAGDRDDPQDDAQLQNIALCLAHNERQAFNVLRPKAFPTPAKWRVEGPFDSSYSLALVNREIARALAACGQEVSLHSTEGPGDFLPSRDFLNANPDLDVLYQRSTQESPLDVDVTSRNLYPPRVLDLNSRLNFLHAYGWEESGFPLQWASEFNAALQGMTVMSEHVRKIMIDHGVTVPIDVSGLGVDHWDSVKPDPNYRVSAKGFRFLHVSSCFPRKGVDAMLRAYGQAFCASDDVTLIIKTFKNPHNEVHQWLDQARGDRADFPDVIILEEDFSESALKALYEQCHALVAPSRAEGFGLPMAEAMLSNLAVITTGWGGQVDFCNEHTAWLIDYSFSRAQTHFGLFNTAWADPDEKHLAALMKEVMATPEPARLQKIHAGQALLRSQFTWKQVANRMLRAAQRCAACMPAAEPRIGWVSTWNTRCGIATYSEHLVKHLSAPVTILAAETDLPTAADCSMVRRCWQPGNDDPLFNLRMEIEQTELDVVVVQVNYGFFNFQYLANFLDSLVQTGRVVVATLHATIDPTALPHKKLRDLVPALSRCDRVLVHSHADVNRLKQLGVARNVTLFPHGIVQSQSPQKRQEKRRSGKQRNGKRPHEFVLASYGFFLPHKGLLELIDALAILRKQGHECKLLMVNAQYPIEWSADLIGIAKERIAASGLSDYVTLHTDFLEDKESLSLLGQADLVVFPYQETGESASGAVRFGIASGRPVAVTPLPIFGDVQSVVHHLPGTSPSDIAKGIAQLAEQIRNFEQDAGEQQAVQQQWLQEHEYWRVGQRLQSMLVALHAQRDRRDV
mgnify:CR=1 FL=1